MEDLRKDFAKMKNKVYNHLYKKSEGTCFNCGCKEEKLDIHHVVPISLGGTNNILNIVLLCAKCHGKIHNVDFLSMRNLSKKSRETESTFSKMSDEEVLDYLREVRKEKIFAKEFRGYILSLCIGGKEKKRMRKLVNKIFEDEFKAMTSKWRG